MYVSRKQLEAHLEPIGEVSIPSKLDKRCFGGGKSKAPKTPDYTQLAKQQADSSLAQVRAQTAANRIDQNTPYGNLAYSTNGKDSYGNELWKADITLSPEQQQMLNLQNQIGISSLGQLQNNLSQPFDTSNLPAQMINAGQTAQDAIMSRLEPAYQRRQDALDTQLANQGIARGTQAYTTAQNEFGQQQNDAYIQAALQGIGVGNQARQQALNEQLTLRNEPLNALNALRTGSQVQNPSFINPAQQGQAQTPDLLGASQAQYNSQLGAANAQNAANSNFYGGLLGLGGAIGSAGTGSIFGSIFGF